MPPDREVMHSAIDAVWDWSYLIGGANTRVLEQFERTGEVTASS